ncbi:MAG: histidine phosphatase family protein [Pseudomarimonas sp.]
MSHIWAVRHARIEAAHGLCYGHTDWHPGSDASAHHAALLAQHLPLLPIVSSPLQRCLRLARPLAELTRQPLRIDPRLMEMHFGDWEGMPWEQVGRQDLDAWAADTVRFAPPNGESFAGLIQRVHAAANEQATPSIWITHAGVIRALEHLCHAMPLLEAAGLEIPYLRAQRFTLTIQAN